MPELPEVETVRRGLERLLAAPETVVERLVLRRRDLRRPFPRGLAGRLAGQPVLAVRRRAKYLLIDLPAGSLLCHLGMTGSWRTVAGGELRRHDHAVLELRDGRRLAFNDPRRFGLLDWVPAGADHPALAHLGPEPLDPAWGGPALQAALRGRRGALKALIMDQAVVVGVGNIYAQEALFRAGLRPTRPAGRLRPAEADRLVAEIRAVLTEAIAAGGSTVHDFRNAGGEAGWFQQNHRVYGRSGLPCTACGGTLRGGAVGGRGTAWCPRCQR